MHTRSPLVALACASLFITTITVKAADGVWNIDADGNWQDSGNWSSGTVADGADFTATLGNVLSGDRTITLNVDRTIGNITTLDTNNRYNIQGLLGTEILTLDTTTGIPEFNIANGDLNITAILAGNDGIVKTGTGDLTLNAANTFTGGIELSAGRIIVFNGANEGIMLGDSGNTLTFTGNADLHNNNGQATLGQNIAVNGGVTARLTGAFGERTQVDGVVSGSGDLIVQGFSAGFDVELRNTANTFTGNIEIRSGDSATLGVRSLGDGATTIGLQSSGNNGGRFEFLNGASSAMTFNSRQFELIANGNSGTNLGRQAAIFNNNSSASNILTINTDLAVSGTGNKNLILGGGNSGNNAFNGAIVDAIGADTLSLYKQNGGTWILGGANTYEGDTTVDQVL